MLFNNEEREKIEYLMSYLYGRMEVLSWDVIDDSEDDPHHSAVTLNNLVCCFVDICEKFNIKIPFHDLKSFCKSIVLSDEDYQKIESIRKKESQYYIGRIFNDSSNKTID